MYTGFKLAEKICSSAADCNLPNIGFTAGALTGIVGLIYKVLAATSVLFLMFGAWKYAASGGDSSGIKNAKETIMYAVFGLLVSLLAFAAVKFLTDKAGGL
jgi:hypothetical protein